MLEISPDTIIIAVIVVTGIVAVALISRGRKTSPANSAIEEIRHMLETFKSEYDKDRGREEEIDSGPKRGFKFEDYCKGILDEMAEVHSDKIESTKDKIGELSGRKVGDFVMSGDWGRVVFEAKAVASKKLTTSGIESEIREAITNRNADYGVFVAESTKSISRDIGLFNEYSGKYLVCALSDGDRALNDVVLKAAYKWARNRVMSRNRKDLDSMEVRESIERIQESLKNLNGINTQCINIRKAAGEIDTLLKKFNRAIDDEISKVLD